MGCCINPAVALHLYVAMKVFFDQIFPPEDVKNLRPAQSEFEGCTFKGCDFSRADFSESIFTECTFAGCNLSMAKLHKAALRDVRFSACKMLGLHFDDCIPAGLSLYFEDCALNHSTFTQLKLKKTVFKNALLHEADFTGCDLSSCVFSRCDFTRATFENTTLEKADLRTSFGYSIDPESNRLAGARFALPEVLRLLDKYNVEIET